MTHVVVTSDFHGKLPEIPECDLLLIAGDVTPVWNHEPIYQTRWLRNEFSAWLNSAPAENIVWVAGNHDLILEKEPWLGQELRGTYLNNNMTTIDGLKIWGSPLSNRFGSWAHMKWERELIDVWKSIPRDIDILITHGPPYGIGDKVGPQYRRDGEDPRVGSPSLANQLAYEDWPNLKLHLFGHIHDGYGEHTFDAKPDILFVNGSHVDEDYAPVNSPREIEL